MKSLKVSRSSRRKVNSQKQRQYRDGLAKKLDRVEKKIDFIIAYVKMSKETKFSELTRIDPSISPNDLPRM